MATKKEEAVTQAPASSDEFSRFTWNVRGFNESLTIRCDSEEELKQLRDRWSIVINPPRRKIPYQHSGDTCLNVECAERGGVMVTRNGTNRRTQQPYRFLRCSNHPTCQLFSYIEDEQNTPDQDNGAATSVKPAEAQPVAA
jgi:hypothetical protein